MVCANVRFLVPVGFIFATPVPLPNTTTCRPCEIPVALTSWRAGPPRFVTWLAKLSKHWRAPMVESLELDMWLPDPALLGRRRTRNPRGVGWRPWLAVGLQLACRLPEVLTSIYEQARSRPVSCLGWQSKISGFPIRQAELAHSRFLPARAW